MLIDSLGKEELTDRIKEEGEWTNSRTPGLLTAAIERLTCVKKTPKKRGGLAAFLKKKKQEVGGQDPSEKENKSDL